ncbi:MAG TPA: hypothetical protein VNL91_10035 [Thermoanaerobaculia bacterium]|nr:hypothetical protein [Thermoanaerobaculia bacterium]
MRAYGSDRVVKAGDGRILLSSRRPKPGWEPRTPRTMTRREHPGTAILWDEEYYEVLAVELLPHGVRYTLAPWADEHAIRVADRYDEESEQQRAAEYRAAVARERSRRTTALLGFLAGHLPGAVQEKLENEIGVASRRMTLVSLIPGVVLPGVLLYIAVGAVIAQKPSPVPLWLLAIGAYMLADAGIRLNIVWLHQRPVGSVFGFVGYAIYWLLSPDRRNLLSPFAESKGTGLFRGEIPPEVVERDAFRVREPFFTLLAPSEQARLADLWDFDYREHATTIAGGILLFSLMGVVSSVLTLAKGFSPTALLSLAVALYLSLEQISRLKRFRDAPAGSALAFLVRPLAKRFLRGGGPAV